MHILLTILGAIGAVAFFLYRLNLGLRAGKEIADKVGDPRRFVRKARWASRVRGNPVARIDDPREVATLLMLAVADSADQRPDPAAAADPARAVIQSEMQAQFHMPAAETDAMFRQIEWLTRDGVDVHARMRQLIRPLMAQCTRHEQDDLAAMMERVAKAGGGINPAQSQIIARYRQVIGETRN